jgi:hypothetical protein
MPGSVRQYVSVMNVESFVLGCCKKTGLSEELLRDSVFGVLSMMLYREEEFEGRFVSASRFYCYVRTVAIREAIRSQRKCREVGELPDGGFSNYTTPESFFLHQEQCSEDSFVWCRLNEVVCEGLRRMGKHEATIALCEQLLDELKAHPKIYVTKRMSGGSKGDYIFEQTKLASALGWDRRRVSERLSLIQQAVAKHKEKGS